MILDEIKALLLADAGVLAQVSTRIYDTVLPRGYTLPAVVYHTVTAPGGYTLQGSTNPSERTAQFDFYAAAAPDARLALKAVKAVLQNFKGILGGGTFVQATFWQMEMDLPDSPDTTTTAVGFRIMAHVLFVYVPASS
jgi:hypothetical protein